MATQQCNMCPIFMQLTGQYNFWNSQFSISIGQKMQLTGQNLHSKHAKCIVGQIAEEQSTELATLCLSDISMSNMTVMAL